MRSRASFKLQQMQEKVKLLKPGSHIIPQPSTLMSSCSSQVSHIIPQPSTLNLGQAAQARFAPSASNHAQLLPRLPSVYILMI
jgi:hypothetical protein